MRSQLYSLKPGFLFKPNRGLSAYNHDTCIENTPDLVRQTRRETKRPKRDTAPSAPASPQLHHGCLMPTSPHPSADHVVLQPKVLEMRRQSEVNELNVGPFLSLVRQDVVQLQVSVLKTHDARSDRQHGGLHGEFPVTNQENRPNTGATLSMGHRNGRERCRRVNTRAGLLCVWVSVCLLVCPCLSSSPRYSCRAYTARRW